MRINLFRCLNPGIASNMAFRYLFENSKEDKGLRNIALSLIKAITGFEGESKPIRIGKIWPSPIQSVGLEVEIYYGRDLYHLSFFFFEYDFEGDIEEAMTESTSFLRGDSDSKGDYFILIAPEDRPSRMTEYLNKPEGCLKIIHADGEFLYKALCNDPCYDVYFGEYLGYLEQIKKEMTADPMDKTWFDSPVTLENYVLNYLRVLIQKDSGEGVRVSFNRLNKDNCNFVVRIPTGWEINDSRGESLESWVNLVCSIEFPRPVLVISLVGECMCFEDFRHWDFKESFGRVFPRFRKAFENEKSLFLPRQGEKSVIAVLKERAISLEGEYMGSVLLPRKIKEYVKNIREMLKES